MLFHRIAVSLALTSLMAVSMGSISTMKTNDFGITSAFNQTILNSKDMIVFNSQSDIQNIITNYQPNNIIYINFNDYMPVFEAFKLIYFIRYNNISCFANRAYGLGFSVYNFCNIRYFNKDSIFFQGPPMITLSLPALIDIMNNDTSYHPHINEIINDQKFLNQNEAFRLNISFDIYSELVKDGYYFPIYGNNHFKNIGDIDAIVNGGTWGAN